MPLVFSFPTYLSGIHFPQHGNIRYFITNFSPSNRCNLSEQVIPIENFMLFLLHRRPDIPINILLDWYHFSFNWIIYLLLNREEVFISIFVVNKLFTYVTKLISKINFNELKNHEVVVCYSWQQSKGKSRFRFIE